MELLTTLSGQILIGVFAVINIVAFLTMAHDRRKARRGDYSSRTPEGFIFFMAAAFGSIGVFLGMQAFRHKTKTWYFQLGIPLLIMQNLATVYIVLSLFVGR